MKLFREEHAICFHDSIQTDTTQTDTTQTDTTQTDTTQTDTSFFTCLPPSRYYVENKRFVHNMVENLFVYLFDPNTVEQTFTPLYYRYREYIDMLSKDSEYESRLVAIEEK